jgi:dimethylhistidine N-methyltransferase
MVSTLARARPLCRVACLLYNRAHMDSSGTEVRQFQPERAQFRAEVLSGLRKTPKELPTKYLYDARGSRLYERICALEEYYPPRTEIAIMKAHIGEMVARLGPNTRLIEYGCGNCAKTRILLDSLPDISGYVPIDISIEQLRRVARELDEHYKGLKILPVCADYTGHFELPPPGRPDERTAVYFPGSTIGNFHPEAARDFLWHIAATCGPGGALLIGVDLKKDPAILHRAYNDREGVTAAFNLNLLARINRELEGDFDLDAFRHYAFYNPAAGRVEMHLVSLREQTAHIGDASVSFTRGESIWTESSYKFSPGGFAALAGSAGFRVDKVWTDERQWFSVQYLVAV